jgi:hypothetical protein
LLSQIIEEAPTEPIRINNRATTRGAVNFAEPPVEIPSMMDLISDSPKDVIPIE